MKMSYIRGPISAIAATVLLAIALPALVAAQATPALTVEDATVSPGAAEIIVPAASLPVDGYLVVHEGDASAFGAVLGSSALLPAGSYTSVPVPLNRAIADGEYLWPMLHSEDNGNGVYDDAATDKPIADASTGNASFGGVVTFPMQLTVAQATAATLTVSDATVATDTSEVVVDGASLPVDGYVVIHEGDATSFGAVIGSTELLSAGSYTSITAPLIRPIEDGEYLWAMLHSEDNGNGVYDDAATDKPIADAANGNSSFGGVVTFPMQLTVQQAPGAADTGNAGIAAATGSGSSTLPYVAGTLLALGGLLFAARRLTRPQA
jgi:uncharacterized Zn-binding protein involved in type VI secretion